MEKLLVFLSVMGFGYIIFILFISFIFYLCYTFYKFG